MDKGRVVLVTFPFDDLSAAKLRPAVCLTEPVGPHRHVILAFISSSKPDPLIDSDMELGQGETDFPQTGLKVSSVLWLHCLMTVSQSLIRRELGVLPQRWQSQVQEKLRRLFGL